MAKNSDQGFRRGAIKRRSQFFNPITNQWIKRDSETGRFLSSKQGNLPYKGVRKEPDLDC